MNPTHCAALCLTLALLSAPAHSASQLQRVQFRQSGDRNVIEIRGSGPVQVTKSENPQDKQIVLEFGDARFNAADTRDLDTSSFDSPIALISPYNNDSGGAKVVVQLRDFQAGDLQQNGNVVTLAFGPGAGGGTTAAAGASASAASASGDSLTPEARTNLDGFVDSQQTRQFSGKPITLQFRDADVQDVFRIIGETSGFNILVDDKVTGKITLSLVAVPWDQALDVILRTKKLGAERTRNVLRVVTLSDLTRERQEELAARKANEAVTPKISRIFPISFAKLEELVSVLQKLTGNKSASSSGGSSQETAEAVIVPDARTNSIIVRDTAENIDRIRSLIETLDKQTPQVLIEGKVVEATEGFSRSLSGNLGIGRAATNSRNSSGFVSFAGGNPTDNLFGLTGSPAIFPNGGSVATTTTDGGAFGLSPVLAFLPGSLRLNAILNMGETENKLKVVSSPRTVVLDKEKSTITQTQPIAIPEVTFQNGTPVTGFKIVNANIILDVSPTVTNEGSVLMELALTRDVPQSAGPGITAVGGRNIKTRVISENGSTLVIGGVYTMQSEETSGGFPGLRKIPILGWLFGSEGQTTSRSELLFFITPRILNPREAGLAKDS